MTDDWRLRATCRGMADATFAESDPFYRVRSDDPHTEARARCNRCPVADECLADAWRTEKGDAHGMRAGLTGEERAAAWRRLKRKGTPLPGPRRQSPAGAKRAAQLAHTKPAGQPADAVEMRMRHEMHNAGHTADEIAAATGRHVDTIRKWRQREGMRMPERDDLAVRERMWRAGHTVSEIAEATRCTEVAVKSWLKRNGHTREAAS